MLLVLLHVTTQFVYVVNSHVHFCLDIKLLTFNYPNIRTYDSIPS